MVYAIKTLVTLLSLLALAHALPYSDFSSGTCPPNPDIPDAYTLRVRCDHSIQENLRDKKIEASGQSLNIGLSGPSTYCPPNVEELGACPPYNETVLIGLASMYVEVPGGQLVYVTPAGLVGYTQAHSAYIPPGSVVDGFAYCADSDSLAFQGGGFLACTTDGIIYKIYAETMPATDERGTCLTLGGLHMREWDEDLGPGAWQYT